VDGTSGRGGVAPQSRKERPRAGPAVQLGGPLPTCSSCMALLGHRCGPCGRGELPRDALCQTAPRCTADVPSAGSNSSSGCKQPCARPPAKCPAPSFCPQQGLVAGVRPAQPSLSPAQIAMPGCRARLRAFISWYCPLWHRQRHPCAWHDMQAPAGTHACGILRQMIPHIGCVWFSAVWRQPALAESSLQEPWQ